MSSNIEVQRICQHCGKEFTAKTTVTKYCGDTCAKRAYKARKKAEKVDHSNKETRRIKIQPMEVLKSKEFLTVRDTATLLGCSVRTAYRLIQNGTIQAVNLSERMTRVKRSVIDKLLEHPNSENPQPFINFIETNQEHSYSFDISESYTLPEVQSKYGISEKALYELIKRNSIPKIKRGWYAYVPKAVIDHLLT